MQKKKNQEKGLREMQREEMMRNSDEEAIRRMEEELRHPEAKPRIQCQHCGKLLLPEEVYEYRTLKLCAQCHLKLKIKAFQAKQADRMEGLHYLEV